MLQLNPLNSFLLREAALLTPAETGQGGEASERPLQGYFSARSDSWASFSWAEVRIHSTLAERKRRSSEVEPDSALDQLSCTMKKKKNGFF